MTTSNFEGTTPQVAGGDLGKLVQAVSAVMGSLTHVQKTGHNSHGNYSYASDADLLRSLKPLMAKQGLMLAPVRIDKVLTESKTRSGKATNVAEVTVTYLLGHKGGGWLLVQTAGSGEDVGDKHVYKALTGAFKYALRESFAVPTGDDPEQDTSAPPPQEWPKREQGYFFAQLGEKVPALNYDTLATWCEAHGRSRPSHMTAQQRDDMLKWLEADEGARVLAWAGEETP